MRAFSSRGKLQTYDVELKERAVKRGCTVLTDCRRRAAARIVIFASIYNENRKVDTRRRPSCKYIEIRGQCESIGERSTNKWLVVLGV